MPISATPQTVSRRSLTRGIAWSVPTVAIAAAVPAYAASGPAPRVGMFNTVESNGYGDPYTCGSSSARSVIEMDMVAGGDGNGDQHWDDGQDRPDVPADRYEACRANVVNTEGSYTPGGTGSSGNDVKYGTGMWLSSPVDEDGTAVVGSSTLRAGAQF